MALARWTTNESGTCSVTIFDRSIRSWSVHGGCAACRAPCRECPLVACSPLGALRQHGSTHLRSAPLRGLLFAPAAAQRQSAPAAQAGAGHTTGVGHVREGATVWVPEAPPVLQAKPKPKSKPKTQSQQQEPDRLVQHAWEDEATHSPSAAAAWRKLYRSIRSTTAHMRFSSSRQPLPKRSLQQKDRIQFPVQKQLPDVLLPRMDFEAHTQADQLLEQLLSGETAVSKLQPSLHVLSLQGHMEVLEACAQSRVVVGDTLAAAWGHAMLPLLMQAYWQACEAGVRTGQTGGAVQSDQSDAPKESDAARATAGAPIKQHVVLLRILVALSGLNKHLGPDATSALLTAMHPSLPSMRPGELVAALRALAVLEFFPTSSSSKWVRQRQREHAQEQEQAQQTQEGEGPGLRSPSSLARGLEGAAGQEGSSWLADALTAAHARLNKFSVAQVRLLLHSLARLLTSPWASLGPATAAEAALVAAVSARADWRADLLQLLPRLRRARGWTATAASRSGVRAHVLLPHSVRPPSTAAAAADTGVRQERVVRAQTGASRGQLLRLRKRQQHVQAMSEDDAGSNAQDLSRTTRSPSSTDAAVQPNTQQSPPVSFQGLSEQSAPAASPARPSPGDLWQLFDLNDTRVALWMLARFRPSVRGAWLRTLFASAAHHSARFTPATLTFVFQAMLNYRSLPDPSIQAVMWARVRLRWPHFSAHRAAQLIWCAARAGLSPPRPLLRAALAAAAHSAATRRPEVASEAGAAAAGVLGPAYRQPPAVTKAATSSAAAAEHEAVAPVRLQQPASARDVVRLLWVAGRLGEQLAEEHASPLASILAAGLPRLKAAEATAGLWGLASTCSADVLHAQAESRTTAALRLTHALARLLPELCSQLTPGDAARMAWAVTELRLLSPPSTTAAAAAGRALRAGPGTGTRASSTPGAGGLHTNRSHAMARWPPLDMGRLLSVACLQADGLQASEAALLLCALARLPPGVAAWPREGNQRHAAQPQPHSMPAAHQPHTAPPHSTLVQAMSMVAAATDEAQPAPPVTATHLSQPLLGMLSQLGVSVGIPSQATPDASRQPEHGRAVTAVTSDSRSQQHLRAASGSAAAPTTTDEKVGTPVPAALAAGISTAGISSVTDPWTLVAQSLPHVVDCLVSTHPARLAVVPRLTLLPDCLWSLSRLYLPRAAGLPGPDDASSLPESHKQQGGGSADGGDTGEPHQPRTQLAVWLAAAEQEVARLVPMLPSHTLVRLLQAAAHIPLRLPAHALQVAVEAVAVAVGGEVHDDDGPAPNPISTDFQSRQEIPSGQARNVSASGVYTTSHTQASVLHPSPSPTDRTTAAAPVRAQDLVALVWLRGRLGLVIQAPVGARIAAAIDAAAPQLAADDGARAVLGLAELAVEVAATPEAASLQGPGPMVGERGQVGPASASPPSQPQLEAAVRCLPMQLLSTLLQPPTPPVVEGWSWSRAGAPAAQLQPRLLQAMTLDQLSVVLLGMVKVQRLLEMAAEVSTAPVPQVTAQWIDTCVGLIRARVGGGALSKQGLARVMEALVLAGHWPGKPALNALLKRARMLRRYHHLSPFEQAQLTQLTNQLCELGGVGFRHPPGLSAASASAGNGTESEVAGDMGQGVSSNSVAHGDAAAAGRLGMSGGRRMVQSQSGQGAAGAGAAGQRPTCNQAAASRLLRRLYLGRLHSAFKVLAGRLVGDAAGPLEPTGQPQRQQQPQARSQVQVQATRRQTRQRAAAGARSNKQVGSTISSTTVSDAADASSTGNTAAVRVQCAASTVTVQPGLQPEPARTVQPCTARGSSGGSSSSSGSSGSSGSYQYGDVGQVLLRALRLKFARTLAVVAGAALDQPRQQLLPKQIANAGDAALHDDEF